MSVDDRRGGIIGMRRKLLQREPWCAYCGVELDATTATLDHVIPRSRGGVDGMENAALACAPCNEKKGCKPVESLACPRVRGGLLQVVSDVDSQEV